MLWICNKNFFFTNLLIIKVHLWSETTWILVIISILFVNEHYNHVHLFRIHDIDALIWQEKLFFPPFSLLLKFIREIGQTWIFIIISIFLLLGIANMFTQLGYTILMLWLCRKSFPFLHCFGIKVHPSIMTKMDTHNNLLPFHDYHYK